MFKTTVENLLETVLVERSDLFLIDFTITGDNQIKIVIDGDNGVLVDDCIFVSRAIEQDLDRETQDFALEVMSAGATSPLVHKRQYKKNLNRLLEVKTNLGNTKGTLVDVNDEEIFVVWKEREPKLVGKGKVTVQKEAQIAYTDILEAKVMIKF